MEPLAAGFWGAFFGTVALMWVGAAVAFARSLRFVSFNTGVSALLVALYVAVFLGIIGPPPGHAADRLKGTFAASSSFLLAWQLLWMLGLMRRPARRWLSAGVLGALALASVAMVWVLPPYQGLVLGSSLSCLLGVSGLALCARSALQGDRPAWSALVAVSFMLVAQLGLTWIGLVGPMVAWPVHAASAVAGIAFIATMAWVLWRRYAYLVELHQILSIGPTYDPVTRMRSHSETGLMIGAAFRRHRERPQPMGIIAISIGNFFALKELHGMPAVNHALFVCAGRLRACVPAQAQVGRLSEDGFLILLPDGPDMGRLQALARLVARRLARPVVLSTTPADGELDNRRTAWAADVGVGLLRVDDPAANAANSVGQARAMSRTAWSFASRVAWFDPDSGQVRELERGGAEASSTLGPAQDSTSPAISRAHG